MKRSICMTIAPEYVEYLEHIAEINNTSRSKSLELIISMVQDYLTDAQLVMEYNVRGEIDGRVKKFQG